MEHEAVVEALEVRLDKEPERMRVCRQTVEHPFGTLKSWMGHTSLSDENSEARQYGDELTCVGL